ncbi:MAG: hypothetical protein ACI8W0_001111 [Flavobacterium sp.]|jgi:hypothetical protein
MDFPQTAIKNKPDIIAQPFLNFTAQCTLPASQFMPAAGLYNGFSIAIALLEQ